MFATILAACETLEFSTECLNAIEQEGIKKNNPGFLSSTNIGDFFNGSYKITDLVFFFSAAAMAFYLVSAGIGLMLSQGNPQSIAANKQKIMNAFGGFFLLFCAYWIVQLAGTLLGLQAINDTFK